MATSTRVRNACTPSCCTLNGLKDYTLSIVTQVHIEHCMCQLQQNMQLIDVPAGAGGWQSGLPQGDGVYTWADGSQYDGNWQVGSII